jgi:hypothetical protein
MNQSSLTTGVVQSMLLTNQQDEGEAMEAVGSAAWFGWLEQATAFTFRDEVGHFTAHKTHAGNWRGESYWRATRRSHGPSTAITSARPPGSPPNTCIRWHTRSRCASAMTIRNRE